MESAEMNDTRALDALGAKADSQAGDNANAFKGGFRMWEPQGRRSWCRQVRVVVH